MACSGWTTHFRQYVFLPKDHEVFHAVRGGDVEKVIDMFRQRRASPFSVDDENGFTLLHVCFLMP